VARLARDAEALGQLGLAPLALGAQDSQAVLHGLECRRCTTFSQVYLSYCCVSLTPLPAGEERRRVPPSPPRNLRGGDALATTARSEHIGATRGRADARSPAPP